MIENSTEYQLLKDLLKCRINESLSNSQTEKLFSSIYRHRLLPYLENDFLDLLDSHYRNLWREMYQKNSFRALQLTAVLVQIINEFNNNQIEICTIKGPVLAQNLYGDPGKRHFNDLDLIVKRADIQRVMTLFHDLGFTMSYPKDGLSQKQWSYYFRYKNDIGLYNQNRGAFVELHVGIFRHGLLRKSKEGLLLDNLEDTIIGGKAIQSLNKNNAFLYLLFHGGQHLFFRLFWLRDIAEAIKKWELDHNMILKNAYSLGIERLVGTGLLLAKEIFATTIPKEYETFINQNHSVLLKLTNLCIRKIFGPENDTIICKLRRYYFRFLLKPGLQYKWSVVTSFIHRWYIRKFLGGH